VLRRILFDPAECAFRRVAQSRSRSSRAASFVTSGRYAMGQGDRHLARGGSNRYLPRRWLGCTPKRTYAVTDIVLLGYVIAIIGAVLIHGAMALRCPSGQARLT